MEIPQVAWVTWGMPAKIANTFRRLSGYVLFLLLLSTAHLGGAWSTWVTSHSQPVVRFIGYTVAPIVAILAIYSRVRLVDLLYEACVF
jgi:cytochrome b-561 domain-containing protein 2